MDYYIQGDPAKAEQIKSAFKKLGYDTSRHLFNAKSVLYFTLNGEIMATTCNCTPAIIKTHPDYKELELPVEPKFKVGDGIKTGITIDKIAEIDHATRRYYCESGRTISFENQDLWHLAPKPHYDIANFKPFDKVMVRCSNDEEWMIEFYCKYDTLVHTSPHRDYPFMGIGDSYSQCIPFEGNEHLLGTADMPSEEFINW
jgi:hypothetical protein